MQGNRDVTQTDILIDFLRETTKSVYKSIDDNSSNILKSIESMLAVNDLWTDRLNILNTYKLIDINSSYRNRTLYPLSSNFVVPGPNNSVLNSFNGDPVSSSAPYSINVTGAGSTTILITLGAGNPYIEDYYKDSYIDISGQTRKIIKYTPLTNKITLDSPLAIAPVANTSYSIRYTLPLITGILQPGSTYTTVVLPNTFSTNDDYYKGMFIRFTSAPLNNVYRTILSYDGTTKVATLSSPLSVIPGLNTFEIDVFSYNNEVALSYSGSKTLNEDVCYVMQLVNIIIPKQYLKVGYGGNIGSYPYFYVHFYNDNNPNDTVIYGNNPNARLATFRVPVNGVISATITSPDVNYAVFDNVNLALPIRNKFCPWKNLRLRVTLPNGEDLQFVTSDTVPPIEPNPLLQISALVGIHLQMPSPNSGNVFSHEYDTRMYSQLTYIDEDIKPLLAYASPTVKELLTMTDSIINRFGSVIHSKSASVLEHIKSLYSLNNLWSSHLVGLNTFKFLDIDSTYRDRNIYPLASNFVIPSSTSIVNAVDCADPVSKTVPYLWGRVGEVVSTSIIRVLFLDNAFYRIQIAGNKNFGARSLLEINNQVNLVIDSLYTSPYLTLLLDPPLPFIPVIGTKIYLRNGLPIEVGTVQPGSDNNNIIFPSSFNSKTDYYRGMFLRFSTGSLLVDTYRVIDTYDGPTRTATLLKPTDIPPTIGSGFEIDTFSYDNEKPLRYYGSRTLNEDMCYTIQLSQLSIPKNISVNGYGMVLFGYPYLYVNLYNVNNRQQTMYTNNRKNILATFKVPINTTTTVFADSVNAGGFVVFDNLNLTAPTSIKFAPWKDIHFEVTLPTGENIILDTPDNTSPAVPNPLLQISALFSLNLREAQPKMGNVISKAEPSREHFDINGLYSMLKNMSSSNFLLTINKLIEGVQKSSSKWMTELVHGLDTIASANDLWASQLITLNTFRYLDISSDNRNRWSYPSPSNFVIKNKTTDGDNIFNSNIPVCDTLPIITLYTSNGSTNTYIYVDYEIYTVTMRNYYLEINGVYSKIQYWGSTGSPNTVAIVLYFPLPFVPGPGIKCYIRKSPPYLTGTLLPGSTETVLMFPNTFSDDDDYYNGMVVRFTSGTLLDLCANIISYNGTTKTALLSMPLPSVPLLNTFEIAQFSYDGENPLYYNGSRTLNNDVCYNMQLMQISMPNIPLKNGYHGTIGNYPYLYVHLYNEPRATEGSIYSNNPNSLLATFKIPVNTVTAALTVESPIPFVVFDNINLTFAISGRFAPWKDIRFRVTLPSGEDLAYMIEDNPPPYPPNPLLQISALFALNMQSIPPKIGNVI